MIANIHRLLVFLVALLGAQAAHAQAWELQSDRWYVLTLSEMPCGYSHESVHRRTLATGVELRTTGDIEMRFRRLGEVTEISMHSEFIESARGEPIEASCSQMGSARVRWKFEPALKRATMQVGDGKPEPFAWPAESFLTPRAVEKFIAARLAAGAAEIVFTALDLQSGCVAAQSTMTRAKGAPDERWFDVKNSLVPLVAREQYAMDGALLESAMPLGIGALISRIANESEARAALAAGNFDLLRGTLISAAPIPNSSRLSRASFRVTTTAPAISLPNGASQMVRIDAATPQVAVVEVDRDRMIVVDAVEAGDARWMKPNALIDSESAAVVALRDQTKRTEGQSRLARAEQLRSLVSKHLKSKNFKTAFGSASEAAESRSGDCTEHAVLLAALLRADGIPSRVVSGVVFVEGLGGQECAWGWHMWTQALVPRATSSASEPALVWVDLDATLHTRFHAGHIAVAVSDLASGGADPVFLGALALIGQVKIELVEGSVKHDR